MGTFQFQRITGHLDLAFLPQYLRKAYRLPLKPHPLIVILIRLIIDDMTLLLP